MGERKLRQLGWCIAVTAGVGSLSLACTKEDTTPGAPASPASRPSVALSQVFRFDPPHGTEYVRTDRRSEEVLIVGTPVRRIDDEELRWRSRIERVGDEYRVKQDLVYLSLARNGEPLVEGKVPEGIWATLLVDEEGTLKEVSGLDETAETLRSLVAPGREAEADQFITEEAFAELVAARYTFLSGGTIGRPSAPGSTWTIENPPGSLVASRTVSVTGHEGCGSATCARLKVDFELDPEVVTNAGIRLVKASASAAGEDPATVTARDATYEMSGWMLIEPATMLSHGASLSEAATLTVVDATEGEVTIQIKGTTELSYAYGSRAAALPRCPEPKTAAR